MATPQSTTKTKRKSSTPEYRAWYAARARCRNPNTENYHRYGGRGITVCPRWNQSFDAFLSDVGRKPTPKHSIDRIDNDKGYWCGKAECPECGPLNRAPNCRWATAKEQKRNTAFNRILECRGERRTLAEWAEGLGATEQMISGRLANGWSVEDAVSVAPGLPNPRAKTKTCERCGKVFECKSYHNISRQKCCSKACCDYLWLVRSRNRK